VAGILRHSHATLQHTTAGTDGADGTRIIIGGTGSGSPRGVLCRRQGRALSRSQARCPPVLLALRASTAEGSRAGLLHWLCTCGLSLRARRAKQSALSGGWRLLICTCICAASADAGVTAFAMTHTEHLGVLQDLLSDCATALHYPHRPIDVPGLFHFRWRCYTHRYLVIARRAPTTLAPALQVQVSNLHPS